MGRAYSMYVETENAYRIIVPNTEGKRQQHLDKFRRIILKRILEK
jgi:hypothetical protein